MSGKRVSYINLLKEAISEYDTSKTVDVKGPFLDAIVSYKGDGELPTHKDAASVLERYYFNQDSDKGVEVNEAEYDDKLDDGNMKKSAMMKHAKGTGTEQAGTDEKVMDKNEEDIAKESEEFDYLESLFEQDEEEGDEKDEEKEEDEDEDEEKEEEMEEGTDLTEDVENAIVEKLISEMEEEDDEGSEEEMEEMDMNYKGDGVKPGMTAPKEKEMKDTEEHSMGAGTEQAGTGDAEGEVPSRKDQAEKMVKPKKYVDEQDEGDMKDAAEEADDAEDEMEENMPLKRIAGAGGEGSDADYMEEAFKIFKEEMENDDDMEEVDVDTDEMKA